MSLVFSDIPSDFRTCILSTFCFNTVIHSHVLVIVKKKTTGVCVCARARARVRVRNI